MTEQDRDQALNRTPLEVHVKRLLDQIEADTPPGGSVELGSFITVVEYKIDEGDDGSSSGLLVRHLGSPPTAIGLLRLGEESIKDSLNEDSTLSAGSDAVNPSP
jgi:hypothetical protein